MSTQRVDVPGGRFYVDIDEYWETRRGTRIHYKQMTDNHLINTLRRIKRTALVHHPFMSYGWRYAIPDSQQAILRHMEEEAVERALIWDPAEVKVVRDPLRGASSEELAPCTRCSLGLYCKSHVIATRACTICKRVFVALGGTIGTVFVEGTCARITAAQGVCHECTSRRYYVEI